jgi:hypothetical protein
LKTASAKFRPAVRLGLTMFLGVHPPHPDASLQLLPRPVPSRAAPDGLETVVPDPPQARRPHLAESAGDEVVLIDGRTLLEDMEELERLRWEHPRFYALYFRHPGYRARLVRERSRIRRELARAGTGPRARRLRARLRAVERDLRLLARIPHLEEFRDLLHPLRLPP